MSINIKIKGIFPIIFVLFAMKILDGVLQQFLTSIAIEGH